ncbi:MAG: amino acid adenylation domain-containing protein, partial [Bacteroidota bacterium]
DPQVLDKIKAAAPELAAIIIEPIQPNAPHRQHRALFHAIREITQANEVAMIFDEMITGFRVAPRGAQQWFEVEVDLIAYGKIISGGLPMAAVAGKARFMDAFDGGQWTYGDDSYPEAGVTFFGGTFVKHPLSLAAAYAALKAIEEGGQAMYDQLNLKTAHFAERLKTLFVQKRVPLQLLSTASVIAIKIVDKHPLSRLFFYYLRLKGIHIKEKAALLSTAHTAADLERTYQAMEESIDAMLEAGFFLPLPAGTSVENIIVYPPGLKNGWDTSEAAPPVHEKKNIPLTEGQKEVWIEQRLGDEAAAAYNLSSNIRLQGALNVAHLQLALQQLVDRHEALRTVFDQDQPVQHIRSEWTMDFPVIDLSNYPAAEQQQQLAQLCEEEAIQPLPIFTGPPFRACIVKISGREHHLLMTAHHGIADGWSCGVLVRDLSQLYTAILRQTAVDLPHPKQISAYALEHDAERLGEERMAARDYWVNQFADNIPVLELPTDRSRPPLKTYAAQCEKISIDADLFHAIKTLAAEEGSTLFVLLYAAFQTFLHRLSGQDDFVLGLVAAGQSIAGNEHLVTHGVSLLPLRMRLEPTQPFSDHLKAVRGQILDAFEHQNYTLGALVKALNLPRDLSRQPIMSVLFNMDSPIGTLVFDALEVEQSAIPRKYETFDIFINIKPTRTGLEVEWTYNIDLFDRATIQRRLLEFKTLLHSMVDNVQTPLARLHILPAIERRLILEEWNDTKTPYQDDICIHELFAEQATRTPDDIAVECDDRQLTYRTLEEAANRLAHLLVERGVKRGDFVAIYLDRSVDLVTGLLAILKAGGIYVPLDPANPRERLEVIIEDAASEILLTQQKMLDDLPTTAKSIIVLEAEEERLAQLPTTAPVLEQDSRDMAYVIYTSGSTGRPKGIVIPHHAVIDHHFAMIAATGIDEKEVILSVASVSFDPSVQDFFLPLFIGARVVIATEAEKVDGFLLQERIDQSDITFLQATPATWRMLMMANWKGSPKLKMMSVGEALTNEFAQQLLQKGKCLWNAYGPSETTIYTTVKKIERRTLTEQTVKGYATIGFPINNVQVYILDAYQQIVPIGVVGELYVGGVGLAPNGYLKRPELNRTKFVADSFHPGETLYRSGDLGRFLPDGDIEFMGRVDHQVKVRGFRIELGEIESLLSQYPGIVENLVVVREDQPDNKRIVAYVILAAHRTLEPHAIKRYLKAKLPEYMVPSAFVAIEQFPLTSTLKIDRKRLPIPDYSRDDLEIGFLAPRTDTEKGLAQLWSELLGIQELGINDNFFELGGHSLIAVNMMARIEKQFDRKLPLSSLLENATIRRLAELLDQKTEPIQYNSLIAIKASGRKVPIYLVHGAGLHVLLFQTLADHMDAEQPIYALQARGLNGEATP